MSPIGTTPVVIHPDTLKEHFSLTLLTSLTHDPPAYVDIREESNTQHDFLRFLEGAVQAGYLGEGDVLVMDNAAVHFARDTFEAIDELCASACFTIRFLPAYSPEYNPCELIFSQLKRWLRQNRSPQESLHLTVLRGIATISDETVIKYYEHCVNALYN